MASTTATSAGPIKLFTYFRSSCAWRVRIALELKNIRYEPIFVNLLKDEQNKEEFSQFNPMHQVPALLMYNQCLTQSLAIIEYLDEVYPECPLMPKDPLQRFRVRQVSEIVVSGIQPLQNLGCLKKVSEDKDKKTEFAAFFIKKGLATLEKILADNGGKYCVGDDVTMADICLVPQVASAERFNVSLDPYPTVQRIYSTLSELEPFKKAHAFAQEDCPEELTFKNTLKLASDYKVC